MNILILNLHSAKNLGDDAIMLETLRGLRARFPDARITAAANDPDSWTHHPGLHTVPSLTAWMLTGSPDQWMFHYGKILLYHALLAAAVLARAIFGRRLLFGGPAQRQTLQAYADADLVLSCGGGNFYSDHNFSLPLVLALTTLLFAEWSGKPVVMLPQSIGPIHGAGLRGLARIVFQRARHILVREEISAQLLTEIGVRQPAVVLPDLAFGLPAIQPAAPLQAGTVRIGLTLIDRGRQSSRFHGQAAYEDALFGALSGISLRHAAEITLFVQCYGPSPDQDDRAIGRRFFTRLQQAGIPARLLDRISQVEALRGELAQMDLVIGTRMHTGILAFTAGIPTILIAYQPKAAGTLALMHLSELCLPIEQVTADSLLERIGHVLNHHAEYHSRVAGRMTEIRSDLAAWTTYLSPGAH